MSGIGQVRGAEDWVWYKTAEKWHKVIDEWHRTIGKNNNTAQYSFYCLFQLLLEREIFLHPPHLWSLVKV